MTLLVFIAIAFVGFLIPLIVMRFGKEWLIALLPIYLVTGNVFAESFVTIAGFLTSLAVPIYACTFLITDLLCEHYSFRDARRAVYIGLMGQLVFVGAMLAITHSPLGEETVAKYATTFAFLPRLVVGSFIAYIISQQLDIRIYLLIKRYTGEDRLVFLRNNGSTMVSQLVDTTIFLSIAFYGRSPFESIGPLATFILTTWVFKVAVAAFDTPYIYMSRWMYSRR